MKGTPTRRSGSYTENFLDDGMRKVSVGILGATGMVGQTLVRMLENHPWFEVSELAASGSSAGKTYEEAMENRWNVSRFVPEYARRLIVRECRPGLECEIVLSALDSGVAFEIEEDFAKAGYAVSSNAKNHRMEKDVPLLIPEINSDHLGLIGLQRKRRGWKGFIVTDPNCSTIHMCLALKPLLDEFGLEKVGVTTMQAVSGAGYPGVPSMDIIDNVVPFIKDEEEKLESEPLKIFGRVDAGGLRNASIGISASCNRVAVRYGHTECVSVKLSRKVSREEIISSFGRFRPRISKTLPSAPKAPVVYASEENRPQPKLDADIEGGMVSVVGRLRECAVLDYKFVVLGNNLVRGAAGAAILNAELLKERGYIG